MASGRVGGTRSLKSGKVGDEVLSVTANGDGTYSQQVSAYVPSKQQTKTVRLAAQQMATAMVEAMMRDLKPLGKVSFQSAANKSKSLNAFSSWNLYKVQNEMKNYWEEYHEFMFPGKGNNLKLGGTWILSSGTLRYNCWDGMYSDYGDADRFDDLVHSQEGVIGVFFEYPKTTMTIGEYMDKHNLLYNTEMWLAMFWLSDLIDPWPDPRDPYNIGIYSWKKITLNPKVRRNEIVSEETLANLFITEAKTHNFDVWARPNEYSPNWKHARCLGFKLGWQEPFMHQMWFNGFTINFVNGRKQISSSIMEFVHKNPMIEIDEGLTADWAVYTWTDQPVPRPVPYPW